MIRILSLAELAVHNFKTLNNVIVRHANTGLYKISASIAEEFYIVTCPGTQRRIGNMNEVVKFLSNPTSN